jgi:excisionase family DNA binding protein
MNADKFTSPSMDPTATVSATSHKASRDRREHRAANGATGFVDEEVLTYREAAPLLKVSARTLERWTREGLVPYIRLPQRGRWSGVRFSRNQLLRWLRQRTVRER